MGGQAHQFYTAELSSLLYIVTQMSESTAN